MAPPVSSPTSTPTVAPTATTVSGTVVDYATGAGLSGATVTVGSLPNASTCNEAQTQSLNVCGTPAAPAQTAMTASNGTFTINNVTAGAHMLTVANGAGYATLHAQIAVASGANALGTFKITALSSDEQHWLADVNAQRATVSSPTSFANLAVDEYAEEQARKWAADVVSGATTYGDAGYAPYQTAYGQQPGAMYGASGVLALVGNAGAYLQADTNWMSEKANCPNGDWQTCTFADNTGHYMNLSNTVDVWVGLGESANAFNYSTYGAEWAYNVMIIMNVNGPAPAGYVRATAGPIRRGI